MRTLNRNKQIMKYSLHLGIQPIYKTDDDGNYILNKKGDPIKTGESEVVYSDPTEFRASISFSGGETQVVEFGADFSSYDACIIVPRDSLPIKEMSLIWRTSVVKMVDGKVDPKSADYVVKRKSPSLNYDKFLLERIIKNEH